MLELELKHRQGAFALEASLRVPARGVTVLVGESGSGKTTLLRLVAGLARAAEGRIVVDGETWFDSARGVFVHARDRAIGYVAQDHALFPHLSAADNVAFGLRAQGVREHEVRERVAASLASMGVGEFAARRPGQLSGGQQQRVAIARALVLEPRLLLLDEPLASLDVATRRAIRGELRRLLATLPCTTLYVTHSPAEALALGDDVTVFENGRVSQSGSREELMRHPRSAYVAEFLGVNLFRGRFEANAPQGARVVALPLGMLVLDDEQPDTVAIVHPREITLSRGVPEGTARNVFAGVIEELAPEPPHGELVRVSLGGDVPLIAEVTRGAVEALGLTPGAHVYASFKAAGVTVVG